MRLFKIKLLILVTYWEDRIKRMGLERCMWGATTETERETKRNKCGCKMLSVFEPECSLPSCLSCLLSEIKIDRCFWNASPKEDFCIQCVWKRTISLPLWRGTKCEGFDKICIKGPDFFCLFSILDSYNYYDFTVVLSFLPIRIVKNPFH